MTMFNRTLRITRRMAAVAASTIVLGLAARTPSALALTPQPLPIALIAAAHPPAPAPAPAPATKRAARDAWSRRVGNNPTARTRCSARPMTSGSTRPSSTGTRLPGGRVATRSSRFHTRTTGG